MADALRELGKQRKAVLVDPARSAVWALELIKGAGGTVIAKADPCQADKACKNETELQGAREAHRRDGVALCSFLAWLDREASSGEVDEITAAETLEKLRMKVDLFRDLSFDTISGSGPNGAIVHYRVSEKSNRVLRPGDLYLVDSGGQYLDGTTDVTRTIAIGEPGAHEREMFTRVLKGHIALAQARFPENTTGHQLDVLARGGLWQAGRDFKHGTGHGVGSYLGVHEGPQSISPVHNGTALKPGMIVSDEPGYYEEGKFGIRIENLVAVLPVEDGAGDTPFFRFETLTLAPIDRRLIEPVLLDDRERAWLDGYHARVRNEIGPHLSGEDLAWLEQATQPIGLTE
jgi:Xaa-Pro aminopeptidase